MNPPINFYYKSIPNTIASKYAVANGIINIDVYSDIDCTTRIGTLNQSVISLVDGQMVIEATLLLTNNSSISYNYLRSNADVINPYVTFKSGVFSSIKSFTRIYLTDDLRQLIIII